MQSFGIDRLNRYMQLPICESRENNFHAMNIWIIYLDTSNVTLKIKDFSVGKTEAVPQFIFVFLALIPLGPAFRKSLR